MNNTKLIKELDIKAGMIEMGEHIAWGSDSALMRRAARALEAAQPQDFALERRVDGHWAQFPPIVLTKVTK